MKIRDLPEVAVRITDAAVRKLSEPNLSEEQKGYLRRLNTIALNGGVARGLLDQIEGFEFKSSQFDGMALPINAGLEVPEKVIEFIETSFLNYKNYCGTKHDSEARLRSLLMDNILSSLITGNKATKEAIEPVSEFHVKRILGLSRRRIIDYGALDPKFEMPILLIEIGLEEMIGTCGHKDLAKALSLMTVDCSKLCQKLQSIGADPAEARVFGILIGGTTCQLIVAHPTISEVGNVSCVTINLSFNEHWNFNLIGPSSGLTIGPCRCCSGYENVNDLKPVLVPIGSSYFPKLFGMEIFEKVESLFIDISESFITEESDYSDMSVNKEFLQ